jgi:hypothetical protein
MLRCIECSDVVSRPLSTARVAIYCAVVPLGIAGALLLSGRGMAPVAGGLGILFLFAVSPARALWKHYKLGGRIPRVLWAVATISLAVAAFLVSVVSKHRRDANEARLLNTTAAPVALVPSSAAVPNAMAPADETAVPVIAAHPELRMAVTDGGHYKLKNGQQFEATFPGKPTFETKVTETPDGWRQEIITARVAESNGRELVLAWYAIPSDPAYTDELCFQQWLDGLTQAGKLLSKKRGEVFGSSGMTAIVELVVEGHTMRLDARVARIKAHGMILGASALYEPRDLAGSKQASEYFASVVVR